MSFTQVFARAGLAIQHRFLRGSASSSRRHGRFSGWWLLPLALLSGGASAQCVSLTTLGVASPQSFDTLSNTAGTTTNNLTITGWFMTETGGGARDNEQYAVDTGASNTGDTYSYGAAGNVERALGSLQSGTLISVLGACFTNNTGATIASLDVAYTGEQWRIGNTAAARDDRLDFQLSTDATSLTTGTWNDANALDFTNPIKTAAVAAGLDGNAAANRAAVASSIGGQAIANGATFWIRWNDLNASGADDGLAVDDFSLTPQGGVVMSTLNISDVTLAEGDPPGTTTHTFAVTLSSPAGPGGVTFDIATADGTAQDDNPIAEDNDYVAQSLTGQSIPMGSTGPYNFSVTVNRDTTPEPNETFFVNVTNIVGASAGDTQGQGTINNDDVSITPIHDVQGPGASSPIVGASVSIRGIVTGVKSNGFFVQEEDAEVDADPATSEGILVFTAGAPPAAAAVGNHVQVTGTVAEFVPIADSLQPPLTELTSPSVVLISTGNPLPAPVPLSPTFPDPAGPHDQLERLEGMRVSAASLTVGGATLGNAINEPNATVTSNGVFYGVITGVARAFREPGIQAPDPAPSGGSIPPIPRWDANPEVLRVDSDGLVGAPILDVGVSAMVTGLVGPLDYTFRRYTLLPDPTSPAPVAAGGPTATAVTAPTSQEFTVASYNLQRFYDAVNDPAIGEPVLTATAFDNRLNKASLAIRNHLLMPDIVGIVEMENLTTLQALATRISADAIAASQPDPQYVAYLSEGNDVGGIDVGFLVKTGVAFGATPRVTVNAVVQENAGELFVHPDSSTELLNDRPPLRLDAVVNFSATVSYPVTVIVNHLRSLNGANDESPGSNGWPTVGSRVRAKRLRQAESLANLVQTRQTNNPAENIVLVGDFNAFPFNDGLTDSMDVIAGTPVPDNETAVPGDGIDLVNPDLDNLDDTPAATERYSYVFDGNAQSLDHVLLNGAVLTTTSARRLEHPRINADFPEIDRNDPATARRLSDHDPLVAFLALPDAADLSLTKTDSPDPVIAGANLTYTLTLTNAGPSAAANASFSDTLPVGTSFVSLSAVAGWSCTTPAVGAGGTVNCSNPSFAAGNAVFTLTVAVDPSLAAGTVLSNTATATSTTADPVVGNESGTATTTVVASADLQLAKTDTPDPVIAGTNLTYQITLTNNGPSHAASASFVDTLPAGTTFVSLSTTGSWSCTTPAVGATGTVSCSNASFGVTVDFFTLVVNVDSATAAGTILSNTATIASATSDPNPGNESDTAATTVTASADVSLTKTLDTAGPYTLGQSVTYTVVVANAGPSAATNINVTDTPTNLTITNVSGACVSFSPCTIASLAAGANTSITVTATIDSSGAFSNSATAAAAEADPNASNNTASAGAVASQANVVDVTKTVSGTFVQGTNVTYTIVLTNNMTVTQPDNFGHEFTDILPAGLTLVPASLTATSGTIGNVANILLWNGSIPSGGTVTLTFQATIDPAATGQICNQGQSMFDSDGDGQNDATELTDDPSTAAVNDSTCFTVQTSADLSVAKVDTPDPVMAGNNLTYTITVNNAGPSAASNATLSDTLPAGTTFVSLTSAAGWTCTTPAVGATGSVNCSIASLAAGNAVFTLVVQVGAAVAGGTVISNTTTVSSATPDPTPGNNSATAASTVTAPANVSATKTAGAAPSPGGTVTYTIVLSNSGTGTQGDYAGNEFTDVLPSGLALVSASASSGTAVANVGTNTVSWNGSIAAGGSVTITIQATVLSNVAPGTSITNQGTVSFDADGNGSNDTSAPTDDPGTGTAGDGTAFVVAQGAIVPAQTPRVIPATSMAINLLLSAMLALIAFAGLRRRAR